MSMVTTDNKAYSCTVGTPDGLFTIVTVQGGIEDISDQDEYVLASGWTSDTNDLVGLIHSSLRPSRLEECSVEHCSGIMACAVAAVRSYYSGETDAPGRIPVVQAGAPFFEQVWLRLREVSAGTALTYTEFARLSGNPAASRAAASACARNATALFVPCHRIRRSDGGVGGFRYGTDVKTALLRREGVRGIE